MEFVQFHPTLLNSKGTCPGLISEAVRGEGASLRDETGCRIMDGIHPLQDLAPRDIVSRAIYHEMQKGKNIYLDITTIPSFSTRFPTITKLCQENGIELKSGKIPVVPGAHFMMGGIKVNDNGESSIPYLYAVGEVACTGVHGANRLASNSLLEGIVFANRLADFILSRERGDFILLNDNNTVFTKENNTRLLTQKEIQQAMMRHVGIVRNQNGLKQISDLFEPYITITPKKIGANKEGITRLNMLTTGWLIASSALRRIESRGGHYRSDYQDKKLEWNQTYIVRNKHEHVLLS
jgi:L-aspartate oxidase